MTNNKLLLHNGSWLLVDVKAQISAGDYFTHLHNIEIKKFPMMGQLASPVFYGKILASQTKLEGIPLLLRENVEEKLKEARWEKQRIEIDALFDRASETNEFENNLLYNLLPKDGKPETAYYATRAIFRNGYLSALSSGKEFTRDQMEEVIKFSTHNYPFAHTRQDAIEEFTPKVFEHISSLTPQQEMFAEIEMEEKLFESGVQDQNGRKEILLQEPTPKLTPEGAVTITKIHIK